MAQINKKTFDAKIREIADDWNNAEEDIKKAEQVGEQVVFPAIKELRYAGRRIVDAMIAIQDGHGGKALDYLADAKFDCYRARHDAIDAALSTISVELKVFTGKLGYPAILQGFPDYPKLIAKLKISREKITQSRKQRENRKEFYQNIIDTVSRKLLSFINRSLPTSR